jgi:hypothetical protein
MKMIQRETRANTLEYTNARKEVKVICRRKEKEYEENIFQEIQERYTKNEARKFYEGIRNIKKGFQPRTTFCRNKKGDLTGGEQQVLDIWTEYFEDLLSNKMMQSTNNETVYFGPELHIPEPTNIEVYDTIRKMKDNRAPG